MSTYTVTQEMGKPNYKHFWLFPEEAKENISFCTSVRLAIWDLIGLMQEKQSEALALYAFSYKNVRSSTWPNCKYVQ